MSGETRKRLLEGTARIVTNVAEPDVRTDRVTEALTQPHIEIIKLRRKASTRGQPMSFRRQARVRRMQSAKGPRGVG